MSFLSILTGRDYTSGTAYPGQPSYAGQPIYEGGSNVQQKYPPIWEVPFAWEAPDPKLQFIPIEQPSNQGTRQPFNPYDVGVASYLRNVWQISMERAKLDNTTPRIYEYEKPSRTGSGGNSGVGGVVGWFAGIPQYFQNLREQDKIDWVNYKKTLEERKRININPEGQEVISDSDLNDPLITFAGASGKPSPDASVPEKVGNTWDDFISGVKSGWEAGGMTDYKTPLLIAGGVLLLILIIK